MAFLFRRNKSKNNVDQSGGGKSNNSRNVSTRILQINLDEVKQQMDAEDEAKKQAQNKKMLKKKNDDHKAIEYPEIKFRIEVEYNNHSWTVDRALQEFIALRKNIQTATKNQLRPFALFPYGVSGTGASNTSSTPTTLSTDSAQSKKSKFALSSMPKSAAISTNAVTNTNMANAEAPFLREIRLALDRWLDAIIANPDNQQSTCYVYIYYI